jgi:predicted Zn-dependent protease
MKFRDIPHIRTIKRLSEAIGYLELGMAKQARACLDGLDAPGPLEAVVELLRGEVARLDHRFHDAAHSFESAARMLAPSHNKPIWLALSAFYRQTGDMNRAIEALACARGALPPKTKPKAN